MLSRPPRITRPTPPPTAPPPVAEVLASAGQSLEPSVRSRMEHSFSRDFSGVRVHSDGRAARSADALGALAYTVGHNVVFGTGRYRPGSSEGDQTIAHELAHVVQQEMTPGGHLQGAVPVVTSEALEREAHSAAEVVSSGGRARITGRVLPGVQGLQRDAATTTKKKPLATAPVLAKCRNDARACFSISARRAWLLKPGKVVQLEVAALGGRKTNPTPVGHFTVIGKHAIHFSSSYKDPVTHKPAPMPHYVHFGPLLGFHAGSLARESHGCVHLSPTAAKTFFDNLNIGDKVDVVP
ncbi:DUF4157 domain-containing protein [Streptomyces sp. NPDC060027]|uniref:eCIS core domain-containing protein n=1 Tax=Streptomyces sp. NPDC060027 TaxID=3347040 RepID=UPI0036872CFD